jgi:cyclopropane fatty-acyl-phospholipid synthase-like methyltransferase
MDKNTYLGKQFELFGILMSKEMEFYMLDFSIKSGLFELISTDYLSLSDIKEKLQIKCGERNLQDFLDLLYVNKHLERKGPVDEPKYKTSTNCYLKSSPNNICNLVGYWQRPYKRIVNGLDKFFTEGKSGNLFEEIYQTDQEKYDFLRTMLHIQINNFIGIAEQFDFSSFQSLIDIGGGLGAFAVAVKSRHPHITATTFDLPDVKPLVDRYLKETEMEGKVSFVGGDMFKYPHGKVDVVSMGNILHDWNHEKKKVLFKMAYDMLNDNGVFLIIEKFIDDAREVETPGLISSMIMLIECYEGFNLSIRDIEIYAKEVGFKEVKSMKEVNLAICYK